MGLPLDRISISGFKSIRHLQDFPLQKLNIIVGANGAGKSNFVGFFKMLRAMAEEGLANFVTEKRTSSKATSSDQTPIDAITQLERLAKLKERGAITESEFDRQKAKILGL